MTRFRTQFEAVPFLFKIKAGLALSVVLWTAWNPFPALALQAAPESDLVDALLRLPADWPPPGAARDQTPQYTRESPPPEDAPLDVLGRYWASRADAVDADGIVLSDKLRELLFDAMLALPSRALDLAKLLPKTAAVHDRIKQLYDERRGSSGYFLGHEFRAYLIGNTPYLRDELVRDASAAADDAKSHYVDKGWELEMLAKTDFARAEPILRKFADDAMPRRAVLAKALLFEFGPSGPDLDMLVDEFRKIIVDKNAPGRSRERLMQALLARDWPGRDAWYLDLFRDPSIKMVVDDKDELFSPLCPPVVSEPEKWVPVLVKLVGNADRAVHDNAVQCLSHLPGAEDTARRDVTVALLPWLLDPKWSSAWEDSSETVRLWLIRTVQRLDVRAGIPGLIAVLSQDVDIDERIAAAEALTRFKAAEAAPALRQALTSLGEPSADSTDDSYEYRQMLMAALVFLGAVPDPEAVAALEAYARMTTVKDDSQTIPNLVIMGHLLAEPLPSETTIGKILARVAELESRDPRTAAQLLEIVHRWPSVLGDQDNARRIAANTALAPNIQLALEHRDKFRENAADLLRASVSATGFSAGIFAVLSGDRRREEALLNGSDTPAIRALLASARLAGELLPFDVVDRVYNSGDASAERAAEAYLFSNDGPAARNILNARLKGTVILGAGEPGDGFAHSGDNAFAKSEEQLLTRMRDSNAPDEVFAILRLAVGRDDIDDDTPIGEIVVERRGDTATLTSQGSILGDISRTLGAENFRTLEAFIDSEHVEDLGPLSTTVFDYTLLIEYVHLTQNSARRVYMRNLGFGETGGSVYDKLVAQFIDLARRSEKE